MLASMLNVDLKGVEVLVVEDDSTSALAISRALSICGAQVERAIDGCDGLKKFEQKNFPIVITDINMPGMNGLELVRRIKILDPDVQIIATSANSETNALLTAIELGFNEYFLKPIEISRLLLAVKRCRDTLEARQQLENEQEKFRTVVSCLGEGIAIKDLDYRIIYQNSAMTEQFGDCVGKPCYKIFDFDAPCPNCPTVKALEDGQTHSACRSYQREGKTFHIESSASLLRDARGVVTGSVEIIRDISERIRNEEAIRDLAFHDPLTGLPNRRLFQDRLQQAIATSRRYDLKFGLMYLDLDRFKMVNDTYGHEAGDQVLIEAGERIRSCCRRDLDTISRQGGDEFCIVFNDCGDHQSLAAIAEQLLRQFSKPFQINDDLVEVTTSIGISIFPDNGSEMKELEIAADRAMYAAKKAGKNTYRFWEPLAEFLTHKS